MVRYLRLKPGALELETDQAVVRGGDYAEFVKANEIIDAAKKEAAAIIEQAKETYEAEQKRGYEDGLEMGKLDASERVMEVVIRVIDYLSDVETEMVELVEQSIDKVIGKIDQGDVIVKVVSQALQRVRNEKQVTVRVSPNNVETVKGRINELLAEFPIINVLTVASDPRLDDKGCILESEIGIVDASLDGQLDRISKSFEKVLGGKKGAAE